MNYNKILLGGRLTSAPGLSYTPQGIAVCKFGIAVNNTYKTASGEKKEDPMFIDCTAWKGTAEVIAKNLKKGSPIFIEGSLKLDQWEKDGQKHSKHKVTIFKMQFTGGKPSTPTPPDGPGPEQGGGPEAEQDEDNSIIPF